MEVAQRVPLKRQTTSTTPGVLPTGMPRPAPQPVSRGWRAFLAQLSGQNPEERSEIRSLSCSLSIRTCRLWIDVVLELCRLQDVEPEDSASPPFPSSQAFDNVLISRLPFPAFALWMNLVFEEQ